MINQNNEFNNTKNQFFYAFAQLNLGQLLRKSNISKLSGFSTFSVFQSLLLLAFYGKNLFSFLNSKYKEQSFSKNTYYRFLNNPSYNWKKFLFLLSSKVVAVFDSLTSYKRVKCFILDDSIISRNRSSSVELLARVHDHTSKSFKRGFTMLTLGWSDGYSFIPLAFNMLSSSKKSNRFSEISDKIDHRSNGYKARKESMLKKPEAAILLIQRALSFGITAQYVLMDTWFTNEPFIKSILDEGLDVIGMVKQLRQRYIYKNKEYTLPQLKKYIARQNAINVFGSIVVQTKYENIPVKIVFVRNRNKKSECLYILSTDIELEDEEIVRIYGNRWSIEVFFKASKSIFKLGTEFQSRSYDAVVCHTTVVFTRYIIIEWIRRNQEDYKTYGSLCAMFSEEVQDMDFVTAIKSLMALFVDSLNNLNSGFINDIKSKLLDWITSQPPFIKALFNNYCWES